MGYLYSFMTGMKPVITQFMVNPRENQYAAGHSYGKPGNVNSRKHPVFRDVPQGRKQVVFYHGRN